MKKSTFLQTLHGLSHSATMATHLEPERKLDAFNDEDLGEAERFVATDPYFTLLNCRKSELYIPKGILVDSNILTGFSAPAAMQITPQRFRIYYDTPNLDLFQNGVEVRIEFPGETEHGHAKPYKQVVKLGGAANKHDPTFHRIEISERLASAKPSFNQAALDGEREVSKLLKKHFDARNLRPLLMATTVRTRIWCRPESHPDTVVEFGIDRGFGLTLTGFQYPIFQIEPELISGDEGALAVVSERLFNQFNGRLTPNYRSKPSPGFDDLSSVLDENKRTKKCIKSLPVGEFRVLMPEDFLSLFPA